MNKNDEMYPGSFAEATDNLGKALDDLVSAVTDLLSPLIDWIERKLP